MKNLIKKILKEGSDNEFDWVRNIEPISASEIGEELSSLREFGFYIREPENNRVVKTIYNLGLDNNSLKTLVDTLHDLAYNVYESGREEGQQDAWGESNRDGYNQGYDEGQEDMKSEMIREAEKQHEEGYNTGYEIGYDEGLDDGYEKGYEEGSEKTYYKAFEEGRAYESRISFDSKEYDEDYDDNY